MGKFEGFDSKLESDFAKQFNLKKNNKQFIVLNFKISNLLPYKYTPDFILTKPKRGLEIKGFYRGIEKYKERKRIILNYCYLHEIEFYEITYRKKGWYGKEYRGRRGMEGKK